MTVSLQHVDGSQDIANALREAIERVGKPGSNNYPGALRLIVKNLAARNKDHWNRAEYENIRDQIVRDQQIEKPQKIDDLLIDDRLHVLTTEGDVLRPSRREELVNSAMVPGLELFATWPNEMSMVRHLAHNYCLVYPERMLLLRHFATPGASPSKLDEVTDNFVFHKKVNSVIANFFLTESKTLGMLNSVGEKLVLYRLPAPAVACFVVESYLKVGGFKLDIGLSADAVGSQLSFILPPKHLMGPWQKQLGPVPKLLQGEVGGSQVRLDLIGFTWLVKHGLVDPTHVAKVLKVMGAKQVVRELGENLRARVEKDEPKNAEVFLAAFA